MKSRKIAFLFLIFMCSLSVFAKDSNKEMQAPRGAWKIVVKNNLSADRNDALIDSILAKKNFYVQSKDAQLNSIRASNKNNFKKKIVTYLLTIIIKDNSISVTGKYSTNISVGPKYDQKTEASFKKISNKGIKRAISQETFAKMQSFALLLGSNLEYITN
jgi:FlaG/FlaF family flagellin (archaellin)